MAYCTGAGIILYQPNLDRLIKNIDRIHKQVDFVYCYNNGVQDIESFQCVLKRYPNVFLVGEGHNDGIAKAINHIVSESLYRNVKWLITLDQDSICPANMVSCFLEHISERRVGAICPFIFDKRRPREAVPTDETSEVKFCITSGCFMNIDVFNKLGGMDEYLFIGLVDNEYSYRLISNGYKIVRVNSVILDHELGDITPSRFSMLFLKFGSIFHNEKIKALSYKRKVSPLRQYYATRNCIYLSKKYPNSGIAEFSKLFAIKNGLINILRSHFSVDVVKAFYNGLKEE